MRKSVVLWFTSHNLCFYAIILAYEWFIYSLRPLHWNFASLLFGLTGVLWIICTWQNLNSWKSLLIFNVCFGGLNNFIPSENKCRCWRISHNHVIITWQVEKLINMLKCIKLGNQILFNILKLVYLFFILYDCFKLIVINVKYM